MGNLPVTAVDIVVAVVLLGSAGFAFMRGFVHEVLAITAWVGAAFAALYGFAHVQPLFRAQIGSALVADIAAGATLFLVTLLILSVVTKMVADRVRRSALNSVDSSLGFVFGLVRGAVLVSLAYMGMVMVTEEPPDWLARAKTQPWLERGSDLLRGLAPEGFGAAEAKARESAKDAKDLKQAEETFRKYVAPQPSAPSADGKKTGDKSGSGYDKESRSQLDRLIQSNQ
ncbi:putative membrane protein required for colicin V production [Magnetospirillum sp. LM-5]|uniref:CvpA family protein n=1 Tax=Magnetospirillum sp. LM-5 TaxID=2681466 RepID=UPI00137D0541|nr:CvpA family protein [Magnetospirillum sp. LM-5]CAA7611591.1 putative membrane protein required for colicin V production [Magnetospirillum sp. LM-5]